MLEFKADRSVAISVRGVSHHIRKFVDGISTEVFSTYIKSALSDETRRERIDVVREYDGHIEEEVNRFDQAVHSVSDQLDDGSIPDARLVPGIVQRDYYQMVTNLWDAARRVVPEPDASTRSVLIEFLARVQSFDFVVFLDESLQDRHGKLNNVSSVTLSTIATIFRDDEIRRSRLIDSFANQHLYRVVAPPVEALATDMFAEGATADDVLRPAVELMLPQLEDSVEEFLHADVVPYVRGIISRELVENDDSAELRSKIPAIVMKDMNFIFKKLSEMAAEIIVPECIREVQNY